MTKEINLEYVKSLIDFSKLKRDYLENPIIKQVKPRDIPYKEDLEYLYLDLNLSIFELMKFFNRSEDTVRYYLKFYNIKKSKELKKLQSERYCTYLYGVKSYNSLQSKKDKTKQTRLFQLPDKDLFIDLYIHQNLNKEEILKILNISSHIFNRCRKEFNIYRTINLINDLRKKSFIKKYGVECALKNPFCNEKRKQTNLKKYGVTECSKNPEFIKKALETNRRNHNGILEVQTKGASKRRLQTHIKKYGDYFTRTNIYKNLQMDFKEDKEKKRRETNLKKYGYPIAIQNEDVKEKRKLNNIKKYGCFSPWTDIVAEKAYNTKKRNNSFNKSKPEEEIHNLLKEKFPDTISQYRSSLYPYNCDFYIPSKDVFMEINFLWTHGFHPYNPNNPEDLSIVNQWKKKSKEINFKGKTKDYFKVAIYTWTDLDVRKRELAKANGLNYLEFFTMEEFMGWYNKQ